MAYLGMLCLGGFVGGLLVVGLDFLTGLENWQKVVATIIAAAFGGAVFGFIQYLGGTKPGDALFMYPVGLLLALLWYYGRYAITNIQSKNAASMFLGWGHLLVLLALSGLALALVLFPAFRSVLGG
jgi:hypothetical protein